MLSALMKLTLLRNPRPMRTVAEARAFVKSLERRLAAHYTPVCRRSAP